MFAGNDSFSWIEILNDKLLIRKGDSDIEVLFFEISSIEVIEPKFLWHTLRIDTKDRMEFCLGGISKEEAVELKYSFNLRKSDFLQKIAGNLSATIERAHLEAKPFLKPRTYIRHEKPNQWFGTYKSLTNLLSEPDLLKAFSSEVSGKVQDILPFLKGKHDYIASLNEGFITRNLAIYNMFFDSVEDNPLTQNQRRACVIDERYNLVLAGAGTGKTSTIVARTGYLIKSGLAKPDEILLLAYASEAAKEMDERIRDKLGLSSLTTKTFHSFGLDVIAEVEGKKPSLNSMAADQKQFIKFVDTELKTLLSIEVFKASVVSYFLYEKYPYKNRFEFKTEKEYQRYVLESELRTMNGELVKSYEELCIANFLFKQGVHYEYEAQYHIDTATKEYRQYEPDFYLPDFQIHIEHYGVDEKNNTPAFIDNQKYLEGMKWKRTLHYKNETVLIETYSYEQAQGKLLENLDKKLQEHGVVFNPISEDCLFDQLKELGEIANISRLLSELIGRFKSSGLEVDSLSAQTVNFTEILKLFTTIFHQYEAHLSSSKTIDFDDMIVKAISYIQSGQYQSPYKYILVDEFQDISVRRNELIKALLTQDDSCGLYCVGDDWQSIYRFTGSDLNILSDFEKNYGYTSTTILDKTFRFNNKIGSLASRFIQCNPKQFEKDIESHSQVLAVATSLLKTADDVYGVHSALAAIQAKVTDSASVLILSRFKYKFENLNIDILLKDYPKLKIKFQTIHASKGKEADYVIILGLERGKFGLPSTKVSHPLLELLLPVLESYPYAEERRVFYVALTRAKYHVYLISNPNNPSIFIRELLKGNYEIAEDDFRGGTFNQRIIEKRCEKCELGYMVQRESRYGKFLACDSALCQHTENGCDWCHSPLIALNESFRACENPDCKYQQPICPRCGAGLTLRSRKNGSGKFWGCTNFNGGRETSCNYTKNYICLETNGHA